MPLGFDERYIQCDHRFAAHVSGQVAEFRPRMFAFHRSEQAARRDEMAACRNEFGKARKGARDDKCEGLRRPPRFGAAFMHLDVAQLELNARLP